MWLFGAFRPATCPSTRHLALCMSAVGAVVRVDRTASSTTHWVRGGLLLLASELPTCGCTIAGMHEREANTPRLSMTQLSRKSRLHTYTRRKEINF